MSYFSLRQLVHVRNPPFHPLIYFQGERQTMEGAEGRKEVEVVFLLVCLLNHIPIHHRILGP